MKNGKVIDADGHVFEHAVDWAERLGRLTPPYTKRAPKWVKDDWGRSRVVMEGRSGADRIRSWTGKYWSVCGWCGC